MNSLSILISSLLCLQTFKNKQTFTFQKIDSAQRQTMDFSLNGTEIQISEFRECDNL